jgi:hypothetical protein
MGTTRQLCTLLAAGFLATACVQLLPRTHTEVRSPWGSFEEARAAFEQIVPERTTAAELRERRLDPYASPNVQLLTFSDVLRRFPVAEMPAQSLDGGLRRCLEAGKACTGYAIDVSDVQRDRVGNFFQDLLGFKRVVDVSGWSFNGIVLIVDGRVVYTLYGGQPRLHAEETSRQPLGPLQNMAGEAVGGLVR